MVPQTLWTGSVDFTKIHGKHNSHSDSWTCGRASTAATTRTPFCSSKPHRPLDLIPKMLWSERAMGLLPSDGRGQRYRSDRLQQFPATDKNLLGWYLQDDWKILPSLTINLGLRYEIQTAPTERTNAQEYFDFNAVNPISAPW